MGSFLPGCASYFKMTFYLKSKVANLTKHYFIIITFLGFVGRDSYIMKLFICNVIYADSVFG